MSDACPKTPKCPLFNDHLFKRAESAEIYKNNFCRNELKYNECKRFMVAEKVGKCADFVMPNSLLTVEQIVEKMQKKGLIP